MNNADTFAAFYTTAHGHVQAAVRATLGDAQLASEAVDEAFVRAAERWSTVGTMANREGWTYRVAVNWATSWRRKWALRPSKPVDQLDRPHHDRLRDLDLVDALAVLPVEQRQMLVMRYALGCSVREVADALGVAEGTVKSGVHRARQRLRDDGRWQDHADDDLDTVRGAPRAPTGRPSRRRGHDDSEVLDGRA